MFLVWNPKNDTGGAFVVGYENATPHLKLITNYRDGVAVSPFTYEDKITPFESFELTNCLNL